MSSNDDGKEFQLPKINRYEVEDNAVFIDYNVQAIAAKIDTFAESKFQVRLSLAKNLTTIHDILREKSSLFYRLLELLSNDHQEMQVQLLSYFNAKMHLKGPIGNIKQLFLIPLQNLAKGTHLEIKEESCKLLSQFSLSFTEAELEDILNFANELSQSDSEQNKIVAIQLLARVTLRLPSERRQQIFCKQFLSLYNGSSVRVKKQVILELGRLSNNMNSQFVDQVIIKAFYLKQSKQNAWGIRKACLEVIVQLLSHSKTMKEQLSNILIGLLKDGNKFVRIAAHKVVPEFAAKYSDQTLPKNIFDVYLSLIDSDINNQVSKSNEIVEKVAYYFPGVLKTVGVSKWGQLHNLFTRLLHNRNQEVKKPLADSLHVIAQIIGPVNSKEYLFESLDYILREQMDSIKLCAIRNLSKFVAQFETQTKQNLIDVFLVLQKDPKKWRVRYLISNQLKYLSEIYDAETNFKYLFPISLKLCNDQVSEVRMCASQQIIYVVNALKPEEHLFNMALQSLVGYAASQKYLQRQTFCMMLISLHQSCANFTDIFRKCIQALRQDKVQLVRIALAISIQKIVQKKPTTKQQFQATIQILSEDSEIAEYFPLFVN